MKRFWLLFFMMGVIILVFFGLAMALNLPYLGDDDSIRDLSGTIAAGSGIFFLAIDVLLPVPSSLIMITNGALFGIWLGALFSLLGSTISIFLGWLLGKGGQKWIIRFMGEDGMEEATAFLNKWGNLAIIVSRPIPVLAEAVSIVCGGMNYPIGKTLLYGFIGLLPTCVFYAYIGYLALDMDSSWQSFIFVMIVAGIVWGLGIFFRKRTEKVKFQ